MSKVAVEMIRRFVSRSIWRRTACRTVAPVAGGGASRVLLAPLYLVMLWMCVASTSASGDLHANATDLERVRYGLNAAMLAGNVTPSYDNCLLNATAVFRSYRPCTLDSYCLTPSGDANYPTRPENDAAQLFGFLGRFLKRYIVHESDNASGVLCSDLDSVTIFCRIVYRRQLECQPMAPVKIPDGLCFILYFFQALVAPLSLADDRVDLAPGIRVLKTHYCRARSFTACTCQSANSSTDALAACPAPYVKTSDPTRFNRFYATDVSFAFLTITTSPYTRGKIPGLSQLQCGDRCLSDYDSSDRLVVFLSYFVRACFAVQTLLPVLMLVAAIRSGFKAAWEYPNRLMLYLAGNIFVYGLHLLPHFLVPITGQSLSCYGDDTVRPNSYLNATSLCQYSYGMHTFAIAVYRWVFLFVALCWWHLVLQLQRKSRWTCLTDIKVDGPIEIAAVVLMLVWGSTMVGISASGPFDVPHVVEFCISIAPRSDWIILGPDLVCIFFSFVFMIDGCRRLLTLRRKSAELHRTFDGLGQSNLNNLQASVTSPLEGAANGGSESPSTHGDEATTPGPCGRLFARVRSAMPRSERPAKTTRSADRAMFLLLQRLFLILIGLLITGSTSEILYIVLNASKGVHAIRFLDKPPASAIRYQDCRLATCGGEARCEQLLPKASRRWLAFQISFYGLNMINALLMCASVFSPLAWRRRMSAGERRKQHWRSVAKASIGSRFVMRVVQRPNSLPAVSVSSTSQLTGARQSASSDRSAANSFSQPVTPERGAVPTHFECSLGDVQECERVDAVAAAFESADGVAATCEQVNGVAAARERVNGVAAACERVNGVEARSSTDPPLSGAGSHFVLVRLETTV